MEKISNKSIDTSWDWTDKFYLSWLARKETQQLSVESLNQNAARN